MYEINTLKYIYGKAQTRIKTTMQDN